MGNRLGTAARLWADKIVVVVGSEGGIGSQLAAQLADAGASVTTLDLATGFDASDPEAAMERLGDLQSIDAVFYAAGIAESGRLTTDNPQDQMVDVYSANVVGAANVARAAAGELRRSEGRFVTLNSAFSLVTAEGFGSYSASKAALGALANALRPELSPATVTDCLLGGVRTGIFASAAERAGTAASVEVNRRFLGRTARMAPSEAAEKILNAAWQRRKRPAIGLDAVLVKHLDQFAPGLTQARIAAMIGAYPD